MSATFKASDVSGRATVLVVDDSPQYLRILGETLRDDYEVLVATDGARALQLAMEYAPDVILLDVVMPGMDGFEVLRQLKESDATRQIPVVFVTGRDDAESEVRGLEQGAVDYIAKPLVPAVVRARVRTHAELRRKTLLLEHHAMLDGLTDIPNRRSFDHALEREWRRAWRAEQALALLLVDVDHFKAYNDTYGHGSGDDCLRTVASVLDASMPRGGDMLARYGGEEFVAILPDTDTYGARTLAQIMRQAVADSAIAHSASPVAPHVTVSIGACALRPDDSTSPRDLLNRVDEALYAAKRAGRNRVMTCEGGKSPTSME